MRSIVLLLQRLTQEIRDYFERHSKNFPSKEKQKRFFFFSLREKSQIVRECNSKISLLMNVNLVEQQIYKFQGNWTDESVFQYNYNIFQQYR